VRRRTGKLVRRAQQNDKAAFEELVRRHQNRVFAVAGGILMEPGGRRRHSPAGVPESLLFYKKVRPAGGVSTWLYKITVNECWDLLRKRRFGRWCLRLSSAKSRTRCTRLRRSNRMAGRMLETDWWRGSGWKS